MTRSAGIIGTGLIGASIGLGLQRHGWSVTGWDASPAALAEAKRLGAITTEAASADEAAVGTDLVVLAAPAGAVIDLVRNLDTQALVIDVAGVKGAVVAAVADGLRFVGTHPMAGREHAGPEHASAGLFRGATWIVTTDGASEADISAAEHIVSDLGAVPVRMSASDHDRAVAEVSHLPHLVALALLETVRDDPTALRLVAGGFRDLTRIALSDPTMWADVLVANQSDVAAAIRSLSERLAAWAGELTDAPAVRRRIEEVREVRRGLAPPVVAVSVVLEDRPGSLAAVGRALAAGRVDVRDLQLRHGRHGGGGVLTLSVRPGEAETLRHALAAEGFELV